MKPSEKYLAILNSGDFYADDSQRYAIDQLDELQAALINQPIGTNNWWQRLTAGSTTSTTPSGLYFWGGVGRGKTFLMDIFYQCLPF
jgi:cell division protein ZapE